jgi:hypothetical protein
MPPEVLGDGEDEQLVTYELVQGCYNRHPAREETYSLLHAYCMPTASTPGRNYPRYPPRRFAPSFSAARRQCANPATRDRPKSLPPGLKSVSNPTRGAALRREVRRAVKAQ